MINLIRSWNHFKVKLEFKLTFPTKKLISGFVEGSENHCNKDRHILIHLYKNDLASIHYNS